MNTQFNSRNADTQAIGATNLQLYTLAQSKIALRDNGDGTTWHPLPGFDYSALT